MSKIEVNAIEPQCGTNLTVGASGDTITFPSGTTVVNNGSGNNGGGNDGNNTITQVTATAPTTAEVSQATTTEADADTEANRLLKIKKKGRSQSIISGSQGVTKTSTDYSLGKKSLLGRV